MSKAKQEIALEGAELAIWESRYIDCPFCQREKKMGITNSPDGLLYHCFSTHCGKSGNLGSRGTDGAPVVKTKKPRRYVGHKIGSTVEDRQYFKDRFGLAMTENARSNRHYEIMRTEHDEYLLSIRDHTGETVGEVVRQPTWSGEPAPPIAGQPKKPKALTYLAGPKLAWYDTRETLSGLTGNDDLVVLVEDQISAMKIRDVTGYTAVALLGNWASADEVSIILKRATNSCILWLDPDMNSQAFRFAREYGALFNDFRVIMSVADPKDLTDLQIEGKLLD